MENSKTPNTVAAIKKSSKSRKILSAIIIFVLGILIGHGATMFMIHNKMRHMMKNPEKIPDMMLERIDSYLSLSNQQKTDIKKIIKETHLGIFDIHKRMQPEVLKLQDAAEEKISKLLNKEQLETWNTHKDHILPRPPTMSDRMMPPPPPPHMFGHRPGPEGPGFGR